MPRPVSSSAIWLPGLDGLRAIAVAVVVGYHLGVEWLPGGLLGVGMFFTLSGYLITWILLRAWDRTGDLDLRTFWLRRARRLLPAVVLLLVVVVATTSVVDPAALGDRVRESLAALFYVANWTTIASDVSYFERFGGPGPLDHLWSLAVEEQFYVFWPLVLLGLMRLFRGRVRRVAVATLVLAGLSFVLMAVLAQPGFDATRVYEGTDTRAGGILIGAAVAMIWRPDRLTADITPRARTIVDGIGVVSLAVVVALFVAADPWTQMLYDWGLLLLSVATVLLVAVVVHPASRLGRALGARPLVWIGERSYGIYLWHLPVIVFTPASVLAEAPVARGALQVAVSLALAALSWRFLEDPIRREGFRRTLLDRSAPDSEPAWRRVVGAPVTGQAAVLGLAATVTLSLVAVSGSTTAATASIDGSFSIEQGGGQAPTATDEPSDDPPPATGLDLRALTTPAPTSPSTAPAPSTGPTEPAASTPPAEAPPADATDQPVSPARAGDVPQTSCTSITHVGDSTSIGLVDPEYVPDEGARAPARYTEVGGQDLVFEIDAAMSTVETYKDRPNATDRIASLLAGGRDGCWIVAMGTNESANVAVGSAVGVDERIDLVMEQLGDRPVLWLTLRTIESTGPYRDAVMQDFNDALVRACERYPSMRVYDWRSEVRDEWFIYDNVHFSTTGYEERNQRIAHALARAFPADGEPADGCLVGSGLG